jgi:hypothetical protein
MEIVRKYFIKPLEGSRFRFHNLGKMWFLFGSQTDLSLLSVQFNTDVDCDSVLSSNEFHDFLNRICPYTSWTFQLLII